MPCQGNPPYTEQDHFQTLLNTLMSLLYLWEYNHLCQMDNPHLNYVPHHVKMSLGLIQCQLARMYMYLYTVYMYMYVAVLKTWRSIACTNTILYAEACPPLYFFWAIKSYLPCLPHGVPLWKEIVMLGFVFNVQGSYCIHTVFKAPGAQDSTG